MSGVLAVVTYGLVFASPFGRVRLDPEVAHFLHGEEGFWGVVGYLVNTLIFVISGLVMILNIEVTGPAYEDGINSFGADIGYGVASYLSMTVFRGVVMFGVMPLFRRGHYGYDWRDALVITWGGLRGAVGLALAVSVFADAEIDHGGMFGSAADAHHFRLVVLVHCSLTVLLTLLINAPSSGLLLERIGLTKLSGDRVSQLQMSQRLLRKQSHASLTALASHPIHSDMNWERVQRLANFDEMCAKILGQTYSFEKSEIWLPPPIEAGNQKRGRTWSVWCCPGSRASSMVMASRGAPDAHTAASAAANATGGTAYVGACNAAETGADGAGSRLSAAQRRVLAFGATRAQEAEDNWRRFRLRLAPAIDMSNEFSVDFQARLRERRAHEAKYRILEQLKANLWGMFDSGQLCPHAAQRLTALVEEQVDQIERRRKAGAAIKWLLDDDGKLPVESTRMTDTDGRRTLNDYGASVLNPFPFAPLDDLPTDVDVQLRMARFFDSLSSRSWLLRPLASASSRSFIFERRYDATVGYLLAHEEILNSRNRGHKFCLDVELDARFKQIVQANMAAAQSNLNKLKASWPKLCTALNTFKGARLALNKGKHLVEELSKYGALHETETERLLDHIADAKAQLNTMGGEEEVLRPTDSATESRVAVDVPKPLVASMVAPQKLPAFQHNDSMAA